MVAGAGLHARPGGPTGDAAAEALSAGGFCWAHTHEEPGAAPRVGAGWIGAGEGERERKATLPPAPALVVARTGDVPGRSEGAPVVVAAAADTRRR